MYVFIYIFTYRGPKTSFGTQHYYKRNTKRAMNYQMPFEREYNRLSDDYKRIICTKLFDHGGKHFYEWGHQLLNALDAECIMYKLESAVGNTFDEWHAFNIATVNYCRSIVIEMPFSDAEINRLYDSFLSDNKEQNRKASRINSALLQDLIRKTIELESLDAEIESFSARPHSHGNATNFTPNSRQPTGGFEFRVGGINEDADLPPSYEEACGGRNLNELP